MMLLSNDIYIISGETMMIPIWLTIVICCFIGFVAFVLTAAYYRKKIRENYIYIDNSDFKETEQNISKEDKAKQYQEMQKELQRAYELVIMRNKINRERNTNWRR